MIYGMKPYFFLGCHPEKKTNVPETQEAKVKEKFVVITDISINPESQNKRKVWGHLYFFYFQYTVYRMGSVFDDFFR